MSKTRLTYHIVFATKRRLPSITTQHKRELYAYIHGLTQNKKCKLIRINGITDHIHLLVEIHSSLSVADYVKAVKQATTLWLRQNPKFPIFDLWAEGFFAETVSISAVEVVKNYIINQEQHHAIYPFSKELEDFIKNNDLIFEDTDLI